MSGRVLAEDRATLPPDPRSASAARRLVRRLLESAERGRWADAAELAVSEVVSNAVLHAHTEVEVAVTVERDAVRVDVLDHSPLLPAQRSYSEHATTGRGLGLVAVLATRFGIEPHGGDGKTVWFCVGDEEETEPDLDAWADDWDATASTGPAGGALAPEDTRVVLHALPVSLWLAAQEHHDALIREFVLAQSASADPSPGAAAADQAQSVLAAAVEQALDEARATGAPTQPLPEGHPSPLPEVPARLDVTVAVHTDDAGAFAALQDTLDEAEQLAATSRLLARPALPEIVALRDWACEQVIAQLGGVEPSPWPGLERVLDAGPADGLPAADWDPSVVRGSARSVVAADESNRIIAISEPLARLLGWDAGELEGHRVVTLIPPRLRELHVAGFTRHLTTDRSHILGVPLELPVLRADGQELPCRFLVERLPDTGARSVYLAWIEPLVPDSPEDAPA